MGVRFQVSEVKRARERLDGCSVREAVAALAGDVAIEAVSEAPGGGGLVKLPGTTHPLVSAAALAFDRHYPLALSPDHVWLTLVQGLATHVAQDPAGLRGRFVRHEGKLKLKVRRDEFRKGDPRNPWPEVFSEFTDKIGEHVGKRRDWIEGGFSTTGPTERAVLALALMDTVQHYFEYEFYSLCGIPEIELLGTQDDWRSLQVRARNLGEFGLADWAKALEPLLGACVDVFDGRVDRELWRSFYKLNNASGGPYVTGWINALFPYVQDPESESGYRRNRAALSWRDGLDAQFGGGPTDNMFPPGLRAVPFRWHTLAGLFEMQFLGGFVGVRQDPGSGMLTPQLGWAVGESGARP